MIVTNIDYLDSAIKAYNMVPEITILKDGRLKMIFNSCIYEENTLDEIITQMRLFYSEIHIHAVKKNREQYERKQQENHG